MYKKNCNVEAVDADALAVDMLVTNILVISELEALVSKTWLLRC